MKLYTIESYYEKEAPFQIAWQVKLFDGHALLGKYEHIFYNEVAGYCKCIEDIYKEPHEDKSSNTLLQEVASRVRDIPKLFYDWAENFCWKARKNGYLQ